MAQKVPVCNDVVGALLMHEWATVSGYFYELGTYLFHQIGTLLQGDINRT
jgi:hypothetical protein